MSERYVGAWEQAGLFNPLNAPTPSSYTYYLYSWGVNSSGQLGLGNTTSYSSPKQVGALTTWASASCGQFFTIATKTDGTLWAWGGNQNGALGLNNRTLYSSPVQVGSLTTWGNIFQGSQTISTFAIAKHT